MRPLLLLLAAVSAPLAPSVAQPRHSPPPPSPPVVYVASEDAAMARAVADARASLPVFAARLRSPRAGDVHFSVKVDMPGPDGSAEHVWLVRVALGADSLRGTLDNDPERLPRWRSGDRVTVPLAAVTDWLFVERGVLRGAYTTRVLLSRMTPDARRRLVAAMGVRLD